MRTFRKTLMALALVSFVGCSGGEQEAEENVEATGEEGATSDLAANPDGSLDTTAPGLEGTDGNLSDPTLEATDGFANTGDSSDFGGGIDQAAEAAEQHDHNHDQAQAQTGFETLFVTAAYLNVRSGPSMASPVVRIIPRGTQVANFGNPRSVWLKLGNGQYASAKHLRNGQGQLAWHFYQNQTRTHNHSAYANQNNNGQYRVTGTAWLRVRSAPSSQSAVVRRIPANTNVNALSNQNGWVKIGEGQYVYSRYLSPALAH